MNTFRFYLAKRIHNGRWYQAALVKHIVDDGTQRFRNWKLEGRDDQFLCLAECDAAKHTSIDADPDIEAISPQFITRQEARLWFEGLADVRDVKLRGSKDLVRAVLHE